MSEGSWRLSSEPPKGIWFPSRNHEGGMCDVDSDWFPPEHLEHVLKQFPQPQNKSIHIKEDVHFETETAYHHYQFKGGIPFHGVISKQILKEYDGRMIFHKRES